MDQPMIIVDGVSKAYGSEQVLRNVSAAFERGSITGIVGRNGSGKTVLLKCILGLTPVSAGKITVAGQAIGRDVDFPRGVGFIINSPGFLPNYSGYSNLKFLGCVSGRAGRAEILSALRTVGLDPASRKKVGKYSMGMRQRLAIAQAIMENPHTLILDEPMNSLDNAGVRDMRALISYLARQGMTVLLTSHNHEDIDALCDAVYEMDAGALARAR